jgi:hypothetical protein
MRNRIAALLLGGGAVALTIGLGATSSFATTATTFTVKPGGAITAASGTTTLKDTTTGNTLTCKSSNTTATLKSGSGLAGAGLGSVTGITFTSCTGPLSLTFTVTPGHLPWKLNATSYTASSGVTHGNISGIHATLTGSGCSAVVDGTGATANNGKVSITYTNSTHKLKVLTTGGNLHIYNVSGCLGLINSGDASTFTATYTVSPAQTITSP